MNSRGSDSRLKVNDLGARHQFWVNSWGVVTGQIEPRILPGAICNTSLMQFLILVVICNKTLTQFVIRIKFASSIPQNASYQLWVLTTRGFRVASKSASYNFATYKHGIKIYQRFEKFVILVHYCFHLVNERFRCFYLILTAIILTFAVHVPPLCRKDFS